MIWTVQYDSCLSLFLNFHTLEPAVEKRHGHPGAHRPRGRILNQGVRFYVFGEPFTTGKGVHNIHQNQGDPVGGGFDAENAIWQDGATIVETASGRFIGFLNKSSRRQSFKTDDLGHPI